MFNQQMFFLSGSQTSKTCNKKGKACNHLQGYGLQMHFVLQSSLVFQLARECASRRREIGEKVRDRDRERDMAFLRMEIELWLNHMDHEVHGALFLCILHLLVLACSCMPNVHIPLN